MIKKIALLTGGPGFEREVALRSAAFFEEHLPYDYEKFVFPEDLDCFLERRKEFDLAIPVFHGEYGEDGKIFALLDVIGIPHTFSKYSAHSILLDKQKANELVKALGIRIPESYTIARDKLSTCVKKAESLLENITGGVIKEYPIIFKPNKGGSSFFTYKIENDEDLAKYIAQVDNELDDDILLQEYIVGDEYSVPLVLGESYPILKLEKINKEDFFDYESKYESEATIKETFPEIGGELENTLRSYSKEIYEYFGLKGVSRIDYLVKDGVVYFLEVNTIPGMTGASILPKSWKLFGKSGGELIEKIISDI